MRKLAFAVVGTFLTLGAATNAWADNVVTRWVEEALDVVRLTNTGTPVAGRWYAMTTVAMYDAVNGIDRARFLSTREHALVPPTGAPPLGDRRAAAAAAAHAVLVALAPSQAANLDTALATELASFGGTGNPFVVLGRNWGASVGAQVVTLRAADGTQTPETQPADSGLGQFPRAFSPAQYRNMAPFGVNSIVPYASSGPPAFTSEEYAAAFNEVKVLGSNTDTDPERTAIARQWLAEANTARETGLWLKERSISSRTSIRTSSSPRLQDFLLC
ncbi:MAG: hypothetical protein FJ147_18375 [Deltaproteobacteria bacterium]|nr:hypothetical protein [Deltaproteobacteria bacterium]